jgi:hypothetical protein
VFSSTNGGGREKFYKNLVGSRDHVLRSDPLVELFRGQVTKRHGSLLQGGTFLVGLLGTLGGLIVTDVRVKSSDQHQGLNHPILIYFFLSLFFI